MPPAVTPGPIGVNPTPTAPAANAGGQQLAPVIQGPGIYPVPDGSIAYVGDRGTGGGLLGRWWSDAAWIRYHTNKYLGINLEVVEGVTEWADVRRDLSWKDDCSVSAIVLSGHGAEGGGVQASKQDLEYAKMGLADLAMIKEKLTADGVVIITACSQVDESKANSFIAMAEKFEHPVIVNEGTVRGLYGYGNWRIYYPTTWKNGKPPCNAKG
jgi:hypothetical protein